MKQILFFLLAYGCSTIANADSLHDVVEYAIHSNPNVLMSKDQQIQAYEDVTIARSKFLPSLELEADGGPEHSRNNNTNFRWAHEYRRQAILSLTQNIFNGFADYNHLQSRSLSLVAARYKLNNTVQQVSANIVVSYLNVLLEKRLVALAKENRTKLADILKLIKQRADSGISRKADVAQVRSRYDAAKSNVEIQTNNLEDARAEYMHLVGKADTNLKMPKLPDAKLPANRDEALKLASMYSPAVYFARTNMLARTYARKAQNGTYMPAVDLVLLSRRGKDLSGVSGVSHQDVALLKLHWNLFNGFADYATARKLAARRQESFEQVRSTLRAVNRLVRLSWNSLQYSKRKLKDFKSNRDNAKKALDAYWKQFKINKRTLVDVLNVENEYFTASRSYEQARFQVLLAKYDLLNSMGLLTDRLGVRLPVGAKKVVPATDASMIEGQLKNAGHDKWLIHLQTYTDMYHAKREMKLYTALKLPAFVKKQKVAQHIYYSVFIGPFDSRNHAEGVARKNHLNESKIVVAKL